MQRPVTDPALASVGADLEVPVAGGGTRRYAHLDHAASAPAMVAGVDALNRFAPWYANVHRGAGCASRVSSSAYDAARAAVQAFVRADPAHATTVFTRNTLGGGNHRGDYALDRTSGGWSLPGTVLPEMPLRLPAGAG